MRYDLQMGLVDLVVIAAALAELGNVIFKHGRLNLIEILQALFGFNVEKSLAASMFIEKLVLKSYKIGTSANRSQRFFIFRYSNQAFKIFDEASPRLLTSSWGSKGV